MCNATLCAEFLASVGGKGGKTRLVPICLDAAKPPAPEGAGGFTLYPHIEIQGGSMDPWKIIGWIVVALIVLAAAVGVLALATF